MTMFRQQIMPGQTWTPPSQMGQPQSAWQAPQPGWQNMAGNDWMIPGLNKTLGQYREATWGTPQQNVFANPYAINGQANPYYTGPIPQQQQQQVRPQQQVMYQQMGPTVSRSYNPQTVGTKRSATFGSWV